MVLPYAATVLRKFWCYLRLTWSSKYAQSTVCACAGRQQWLPVKLLVVDSRHYDVSTAFPRQLHMCRIERVPYEETNVLHQWYAGTCLFMLRVNDELSLSVDSAALSSYKNLIVSTDWQSSTDGAVQACANDRAVLYDLRGRTYFVNNEFCSRASESQPSIVAPSMVAQTSSRLIAQRCRPMPQTVDGAQHSYYIHHRLLILSSAHPDVCWLFRC